MHYIYSIAIIIFMVSMGFVYITDFKGLRSKQEAANDEWWSRGVGRHFSRFRKEGNLWRYGWGLIFMSLFIIFGLMFGRNVR